jgi:hypothetical protein
MELADPQTHDINEEERISAINELLSIYRAEVEEFRRGEKKSLNRLLQQWLSRKALGIFAAPDPVLAMGMFLGRKRKRGKRAKNADRDLAIAVEVATKMSKGMTLEKAAVSVAKQHRLSPERVEKIYKAKREDAQGYLAMSIIESDR